MNLPHNDTSAGADSKSREFAEKHLLHQQEFFDSFPEAPHSLVREFNQTGLKNWWLPEEYGGRDISLQESVDIVSELSYGDAGTAFTLFISALGTTMVSLYGSQQLKERYLGEMGRSGGFCATLGSERGIGSDLTRIATTVARQGGHLVLNGDKLFATNAGFADFLVVVAASAEAPDDKVAVLVPRDTPGVRIVQRWEMIGLRSSGTYEVSFQDCRVPADHALQGPGLRLLEVGLNFSRILIAATAVGVSRRIRDLCLEYAEAKPLNEAFLLDHPTFTGKLGQTEMQIDVMRNQCLAAASEFDALNSGTEAAADLLLRGTLRSAIAAKMLCGQYGWEIASTGSEMFGGLGYTTRIPIGKLMRDIRYVSIVEGGDDVLRELMFNRYVLAEVKRL